MCVVSMIMEHQTEKWQQPKYTQWPRWDPPEPRITQEELDEFRQLLKRAREYDKKHNQPDCELDEKRQALKKIAKGLGVEIDFL